MNASVKNRNYERPNKRSIELKNAREKLIEALQTLNIPLPADAEIRVDDHEDDAELGAIPFVTIEGIEFTFGPNGTGNHGGGLGIVTTCPKCQQRVRGPYLHAKEILGRELLNPERVSHVCQSEEYRRALEEEKTKSVYIQTPKSAQDRYLETLREMMREVADEQIQLRTGA